jgi:hypothetical protein
MVSPNSSSMTSFESTSRSAGFDDSSSSQSEETPSKISARSPPTCGEVEDVYGSLRRLCLACGANRRCQRCSWVNQIRVWTKSYLMNINRIIIISFCNILMSSCNLHISRSKSGSFTSFSIDFLQLSTCFSLFYLTIHIPFSSFSFLLGALISCFLDLVLGKYLK